MRHHDPGRPARRTREQGGYVLPMFAIMLTVLMAMAGFGVDVWNWWYNAQRIQRAADSGALAGAIFLPGDETSARNTAISVAASNGYPAASVTAAVADRPNRLRVAINEQVPNNFVSLLGIRTTSITRDATAEFSGAIETGSCSNQMGNQPGSPDWTPSSGCSGVEATNPQVWAQIAGSLNNKGNGDRQTAGGCDNANFSCSGGVNSEYDAEGYYYTVRINATAADVSGGFLLIDVYDPAFVQSGDNCTQFLSADDTALRNSLASLNDRYNSNNGTLNNEYCTGDHRIASVAYGSGFPTVQFRTAKPDATPWNVRDNFGAGTVSACDGTDATHGAYPAIINRFRPYGTSGSESADNFLTDLTGGSAGSPTYLRAVYHQFVRVCAVSFANLGITAAGEYDVSFNARITATGTAGHNRYAIRAGIGNSLTAATGDGSRVSVFASGNMPLYQNATSSTAAFYMARVLPGSAGRILNLEFFDVGDGSGSGTITIVPPPDSNVAAFSGCSATLTGGSSPNISASPCRLNDVSSGNGYNGQRVQVRVPIPDTYTCGTVSGSTRVIGRGDCWVRLRFNWSSSVQDTTTWRASILGDPVRLTE